MHNLYSMTSCEMNKAEPVLHGNKRNWKILDDICNPNPAPTTKLQMWLKEPYFPLITMQPESWPLLQLQLIPE